MSRSNAGTANQPLVYRLLLRAFPGRFRSAYQHDLLELYADYEHHGRKARRTMAWDLLRNGFGARLDDWRGSPAPDPGMPRKRRASVDSIWGDLRFGARMLRKSPAFTAVAVLSLAIGIGANTVVFGFIDAALLRPLAVDRPDELVVLGWRSPAGTEMPDVSTWGWGLRDDNGDYLSSSYSVSSFDAIRTSNRVLSTTFAFAPLSRLNINVDDRAELASGQVVSGNYFSSLGVVPALGRLIGADDDRAGAEATVVVSHAYWQSRFGGAADVLGTVIRVNGAPFRVVGVTPRDFRGTLQVGDNPDVTLALAQRPLVGTRGRDMTRPEFWWLHLMGRRAPGVAMSAAQENLSAVWQQSVESDLFPDGVPARFTLPEVDLRPGRQGMTEARGQMEPLLRIMLLVVGMVLFIACINVANLLLARSRTRRREIAVRLSIGASRLRLVRQLLAESVVLSGFAGLVGVAFAAWGREALVGAMVTRDLYIDGVRTDARVLGFGVLVSLATGIVFGLVPAWSASRPDLTPALKDASGEASQRRGGLWGLRSLMVLQVALSLLLLVTAGLFVRSLTNLEREATGFEARGVAVLSLDPTLNGYDGVRHVALYENLLRRFRALPGVSAATVTNHSPVSNRISFTDLLITGYEPAEDERMGVFYNLAAPEFFDTFQIPLLLGRSIGEQDRDGTAMVAVINETFAERFFAGESPIGKRFGLGRDSDPSEYEVVGVAADVKYQRLHDRQYPVAHVAMAQHADSLGAMTLALRTPGDTSEAIAAARAVVREVDGDIPLFDVRTLAEQQRETLEMERLFAGMSSLLGALALLLACIGLYGILSYSVAQRTREIGVRMALGAGAGDVVRLVMRELRAVLLGAALGALAAYWATSLIESQLYELSSSDPTTMAGATFVLLIVAAGAAYLPARRASSVDPIVALRFD